MVLWVGKGMKGSSNLCICLFPWCKYSHLSQFLRSQCEVTEYSWEVKCAINSQYEPGTSHTESTSNYCRLCLHLFLFRLQCVHHACLFPFIGLWSYERNIVLFSFVSPVPHTMLGTQSVMSIEKTFECNYISVREYRGKSVWEKYGI